MTDQVVNVSSSDFDDIVRQSDVPVIVDVWAQWCAPCRMLAPLVEKFAAQFAGKVKFVKVNKDENPSIAEEFGVDSIPRLIVFSGGNKVDEQIGLPDYAYLRQWIEEQVIALGLSIEDTPEQAVAEDAFEAAVNGAFSAYEAAVGPAGEKLGQVIRPLQEEYAAYKAKLEEEGVEGDLLAEKLSARGEEINAAIAPSLEEYKKVSDPAESILVAAMNNAVEAFTSGAYGSEGEEGSDGGSGSVFGRVCPIDDPNCQS